MSIMPLEGFFFDSKNIICVTKHDLNKKCAIHILDSETLTLKRTIFLKNSGDLLFGEIFFNNEGNKIGARAMNNDWKPCGFYIWDLTELVTQIFSISESCNLAQAHLLWTCYTVNQDRKHYDLDFDQTIIFNTLLLSIQKIMCNKWGN